MTRQECEEKIIENLKEIQKVYAEFDPEWEYGVCLQVCDDFVSAYVMDHDENGETILGKYIFNKLVWNNEVSA